MHTTESTIIYTKRCVGTGGFEWTRTNLEDILSVEQIFCVIFMYYTIKYMIYLLQTVE